MKLCTQCGACLAEDALTCPVCGCAADTAPQPSVTPQPQGNRVEQGLPIVGGKITFDPGMTASPHPQPPAAAPKYDRVQPQQPDGGLTTAQYFWTLMLFAVPVVGLGFMLFWSFGSTASPARRRLARASLMKVGIGLAAGLVTLALIGTVLFQLAQRYWNGWYGYDFHGDYGYYDDRHGGRFEDSYGWPFDFFENYGENDQIY